MLLRQPILPHCLLLLLLLLLLSNLDSDISRFLDFLQQWSCQYHSICSSATLPRCRHTRMHPVPTALIALRFIRGKGQSGCLAQAGPNHEPHIPATGNWRLESSPFVTKALLIMDHGQLYTYFEGSRLLNNCPSSSP